MTNEMIRILEYTDLKEDLPVYLVSHRPLTHRNVESVLGYNPRTLQFEVSTQDGDWPELGG